MDTIVIRKVTVNDDENVNGDGGDGVAHSDDGCDSDFNAISTRNAECYSDNGNDTDVDSHSSSNSHSISKSQMYSVIKYYKELAK